MPAKGALETRFSLSERKPSSNTELAYERLGPLDLEIAATAAAANRITVTANDYGFLSNGDEVIFSNKAGLTAAGIVVGTGVFVVKGPTSGTTIGFAATRAAAVGATPTLITITGTPTGSTAARKTNDWQQCAEIVSVGEFGREYNTVRIMNLATGATRKFKGSFDNGTVQVDLLFDSADGGQTLLETASISRETYACRIEFPGQGEDGEEFYFQSLIANLKRIVGGPDDALMMRATFEIDHNTIVEGT